MGKYPLLSRLVTGMTVARYSPALEIALQGAVGCSPLLRQRAGITLTPLHQRIVSFPVVHDRERATDVLADLSRRCSEEASLAPLGPLIAAPQVNKLLSGIFGASPYLTELIARNPQAFMTRSPPCRRSVLLR